MAYSALRKELSCNICQNLYTNPVSLRCGHYFCYDCIVTGLDTQMESGRYICPECSEEHLERIPLEKNQKLSNIAENFKSLQQEKTEVLCTYCMDSSVTAVKTCLQCETSMCDKHLIAHNKTVDHVLLEPTSSLSIKKCLLHKKPWEYYCSEDSSWLCASCCVLEKHKGHQVELLEEASENKKDKLRNILKKLAPERESAKERIQSMQDEKRKVQEKADNVKERVLALFEDIKKNLEVQENNILSEIARQQEQLTRSVSDKIQQLETQMEDLSKKIDHIEKLCTMSDPLAVLQDSEPDPGDQNDDEEPTFNLDGFVISLMLHRCITDISTKTESRMKFNTEVVTDLRLEVNTAHNFVVVSDDLKTASSSKTNQNRLVAKERFTTYRQVLSIEQLSCRQHYWEVEVSDYGDWDIGVCYPSMEREGEDSCLGNNDKSWSLCMYDDQCKVHHDWEEEDLYLPSTCRKLGIYLDYEAGRLSFYQLGDPIKHLHTSTATFTEPLHAAFYVYNGAWVKILH
ncbi:E3 ubiquitin-protein ligase TRIM39-like [Hyperolius riggenbachi]|uniref:E3 ubiquitin-protein ligase TRIM39-like n=1 Tax=Hyperolius riggenbachi TaxID=752182 RepID=UPI0035A2618A